MSQTTTPPNAPEVDVLAVLDGSASEWSRRLVRYRRDADKANARKGARDIHADRVCEWAEVEREKVLQARAAVAALVAERNALSRANIKYSEEVAKLIGRAGNAESARDALAAEVGALRLDAERWQTIRDSGSKITLRLHCTAPSERERFIDAVRAEGSGS